MGCCCGTPITDADRSCQPSSSMFTQRRHTGNYHCKAKTITCVFDWALYLKADGGFTHENIEATRAKMESLNKSGKAKQEKALAKRNIVHLVDVSYINLEVEQGVNVQVIVYTPTSLPESRKAALVFAHGGWAILNDADKFSPLMIQYAHDYQCVCFSVDFRNAPVADPAGGQKDMAQAIRHVFENAEKYGVDNTKIVAKGESGGCWITQGAINILTQANQQHYVKLQILQCPMLSNEQARIPINQCWTFEKPFVHYNTGAFKLLATDYEKQTAADDPVLYPGLIPDEILARIPPTVITTSELDFQRRDAKVFGKRLQKVGRLFDLLDMPRGTHGYEGMGEPESEWAQEEMMKLWKTVVESDEAIKMPQTNIEMGCK